ncbi:uncharacterized protein LOC143204022 isoform X2 [Rhynchophorus ferrugineus]|uniref:uncharacterized protein LOC143204022 isoform X2 n=1 Tax=Rhynchophorus ferrugineus TaxID=354439 RepID=UPI003FCCFCCB
MCAVNLLTKSGVCQFNISSIMSSGDSPAHHNRTAETFEFSPGQSEPRSFLHDSKTLPVEGRSSPVATTSRDVGVQKGVTDDKVKGEVQASVLVEPGEGRDKEEKEYFGSPTLNNEEIHSDNDKDASRRSTDNDGGYGGRDRRDRKDDKFRKNGNIDRLDGVWVPKEQKPRSEQDDDNCIVKCLYVTMTCCECSIM